MGIWGTASWYSCIISICELCAWHNTENVVAENMEEMSSLRDTKAVHSGLKGETPEKNVSDNPSMDSFTKMFIDSVKLWPKIWEWDLFELTLQNDVKKP